MSRLAEKRNIKNDFLQNWSNKSFSVAELTSMLRYVSIERYPPEIRKLVEDELGWREEQRRFK